MFTLGTAEDPEGARSGIVQALTGFAGQLSEDPHSASPAAAMLLLLVPILLHRAAVEEPEAATAALLQLAERRPVAFRLVVAGRLSQDQRRVLQGLLREHAKVGGGVEVSVEDEKPAIALKMDF